MGTTGFSTNTLDAVLAADLAAELRDVNQIAWETSLAAINAKIIAARAGESARGFQPINDFIGEVAKDTMGIVDTIGKQSIHVSRLASKHLILSNTARAFLRAAERGRVSQFVDGIHKRSKRLQSLMEELNDTIAERVKDLNRELGMLDQHMKASEAVVSVCRIEATRSTRFVGTLTQVADDLSEATRYIKTKVDLGLKRIQLFDDEVRRKAVFH